MVAAAARMVCAGLACRLVFASVAAFHGLPCWQSCTCAVPGLRLLGGIEAGPLMSSVTSARGPRNVSWSELMHCGNQQEQHSA